MITIGMPVFNDVHFIEDSIKSLLNQTYVDFIFIISDDGSIDGSENICKSYAEKDNRIKYIRQPQNLGISKNMEFLLFLCKTKYFMWAGDDDLWHPDFIKNLIHILEINSDSIVAFCNFATIDNNGSIINFYNQYDYKNNNRFLRVKRFIQNTHDCFGYGIFLADQIKEVKFPIWWWPNKKCAYNNIYPSLCYYLTKGNYSHLNDEPLFFKREKSEYLTNHISPFINSGIKETFAYILRRFYLICFSSKLIFNASNLWFTLIVFLYLFYNWFLISSGKQIQLLFTSGLKKMRWKKK